MGEDATATQASEAGARRGLREPSTGDDAAWPLGDGASRQLRRRERRDAGRSDAPSDAMPVGGGAPGDARLVGGGRCRRAPA
jgi:hypothetical protein